MKKYLLAFCLLATIQLNAQRLLLNEVYVNQSSTQPEYIELVNSGVQQAPENLDCYSVATYFFNRTTGEEGFYVIDLPSVMLSSQRFFVLSSQSTFNYGDSVVNAGLNWNTSSSLTKYVVNNSGTAYTSSVVTSDDIMMLSNGRMHGNNGVYAVFLFFNGQVVDVFLGAHNNQSLPNYISELPALPTGSLACSSSSAEISSFDDNAALIGYANPPTNTGYFRPNNNRCGGWARANQASDLTPGYPNNETSGLVVSTVFVCGSTTFAYSILQAPGAFNVTGSLYYDVNSNGMLDNTDVLISSSVITSLNTPVSIPVNANLSLLLVIQDNSSTACGNGILYFPCVQGGPTPVGLKSFNAYKRSGSVSLIWETASETNNQGFEVLRKTTAGYVRIGFVNSLAPSGNSSTGYTYNFDDFDRHTGTVYYRLRQVDVNGRSTYSDIRAVKFSGNTSVLIFPNPASGGRTNVLLPEESGSVNIELYDFTGRKVQHWNNNRSSSVALTNLSRGSYTVKVIFLESGEVVTERIVVN